MAAKKKMTKAPRKPRAERGSKPVFERLLSGSKTRQILLKLGTDPDEFSRMYDAGGFVRGARLPEEHEITAVERFQKSGDLAGLMAALKVESRMTALATVGRVAQYKATHG